MGVRVSVQVDTSALKELADKWSDVQRVMRGNSPAARRIADKAAMMLVGDVRESVLDTVRSRFGYSGRTGALARSYRESVSFTNGAWRIAAESDLVYARIQDQGGVIRPKTVKALAIPLIPMAVGKWPRHWKRGELFRRGNALSRMRGGRPQNVYALSKSVRIVGKRYLDRAAKISLPRIARFMAVEVTQELARGK